MLGGSWFKRSKTSATKRESYRFMNKTVLVSFYAFFCILFLLAALFSSLYLRQYNLIPIKHVIVMDQSHHVDLASLKSTTLPLLAKGFFRLNLSELESRLLTLNWVHQAVVSRRWPNTIVIQLTEYQPIGRWNNQALITNEGDVFLPNPGELILFKRLPNFDGDNTQIINVLYHYKTMQSILKPLGLGIVEVDLSQRLSWTVVLNNQAVIKLGEKQALNRLKRFTDVYAQVFNHDSLHQGDYIDMRYDHGMAVHIAHT